jgi:hypothetical protein
MDTIVNSKSSRVRIDGYLLVPPEAVTFKEFQLYYVGLKGSSTIIPLFCTGKGAKVGQGFEQGCFPQDILDTDIEFVVVGGDRERLHRANQVKVWASAETPKRSTVGRIAVR